MRRAEFLTLTGLSVAAHRGMVRKDLLPWTEGETEGWSSYTLRQAFHTALALALAPMVGGQPEAARRVVDVPLSAWSEYRRILLETDLADVYAASFETSPTSRAWAFGRLETVLAEPAVRFPNVRAVAVLNLSAIAREMRDRAQAAGLVLSPELVVEAGS